jgi:hypothetical protein
MPDPCRFVLQLRCAPSRDACLHVIVVVIVGRGRSPLRTLLAPPLTVLGALPNTVDYHIRRRLLAVAWGHLPAS